METLKLFLIGSYAAIPSDQASSTFGTIIDVLTIAVGIFGITSVVIIGIQYLRAPSGSPKIHQAKRHLIEIIAGLIIYAIIYAIIRRVMAIFS